MTDEESKDWDRVRREALYEHAREQRYTLRIDGLQRADLIVAIREYIAKDPAATDIALSNLCIMLNTLEPDAT